MALTVCSRDFRAIGDEPLAVALYYRRKFIVHGADNTPSLVLPAHQRITKRARWKLRSDYVLLLPKSKLETTLKLRAELLEKRPCASEPVFQNAALQRQSHRTTAARLPSIEHAAH